MNANAYRCHGLKNAEQCQILQAHLYCKSVISFLNEKIYKDDLSDWFSILSLFVWFENKFVQCSCILFFLFVPSNWTGFLLDLFLDLSFGGEKRAQPPVPLFAVVASLSLLSINQSTAIKTCQFTRTQFKLGYRASQPGARGRSGAPARALGAPAQGFDQLTFPRSVHFHSMLPTFPPLCTLPQQP